MHNTHLLWLEDHLSLDDSTAIRSAPMASDISLRLYDLLWWTRWSSLRATTIRLRSSASTEKPSHCGLIYGEKERTTLVDSSDTDSLGSFQNLIKRVYGADS